MRKPRNLQPVEGFQGRSALNVSAGEYHTCALRDDYQVVCWGDNSMGQLGIAQDPAKGPPKRSWRYHKSELGDKLIPVDFGKGRTAVLLRYVQLLRTDAFLF